MASAGKIKGGSIVSYKNEEKVNEQIERNYTYQAPKPGQVETYTAIRDIAKEFAIFIDANCPDSSEKALAQTKLQECVMWANASVALN